MLGIQPPARAGGLQPVVQAVEGRCVQPGRIGQWRAGQQVEHFVQAEARHRQAEQVHEHVGQRLAGQRAGVGQRIGNVFIATAAAAEHRFQVRHVRVDVRGQHRDLARLQRWIEARVLEQAAQLVVQHLQFAQAGVAGMHLQAGIVAPQAVAARAGGLPAAVEQIALQTVQQAVGEPAVGHVRAHIVFGIVVGGDLAGGVHHFVAAQHRHEVAAGRAPGLQQAVLARRLAERVRRTAAQLFAQGLQVAPVGLGGRGQVEVQRAHPRLGGHHPQHVRGDVERGEGEYPCRQALWQRLAGTFETRQVGIDAACPVLVAAGDVPPQDRLWVVRVGAGLPAQQPVAAPGLVLLEDRRQLARQRPRLERIGHGQIGLQRAHRRLRQQVRVGQCRIQLPAQGGGGEVVMLARHVGIERPRDELAGGEEVQVGRNAILDRQAGLQPAPHRHLRDQHHLRDQDRLARHGRAHGAGEQGGQHVEGVGVVQAEVGCSIGHRASVPQRAVDHEGGQAPGVAAQGRHVGARHGVLRAASQAGGWRRATILHGPVRLCSAVHHDLTTLEFC